MKFKVLVDPTVVIIPVYLLCLFYAWEKIRFYKEIMNFHYITYMDTPQHKNPAPGVMKLTILVDPSLFVITIYLFFVCSMTGSKESLNGGTMTFSCISFREYIVTLF